MRLPSRRRLTAALAAALATLLLSSLARAQATAPPGPASAAVFPSTGWQRIERPESVGFSSARLEALRGWLASIDTTAMFVAVGGRTLFEYGDVTRLSYLASVRKSVLAMLYGKYVESGAIKLDRTLKDLQFADVDALLPSELDATIEHLITARSGVYHLASNSGDSTDSAPPRGSQAPGSYYLYNNWDFNAAGAVFEQLTGRDIYDALETDLARPIGMQDFDRSRQEKSGDPKRSRHLAYHMFLSTRDMARIGLLMLRDGNWDGKQIIPRGWAQRIRTLVTPLNEMNPPYYRALGTGTRWGYGYMWWVWDAPNSEGPFKGAYSGMGAGGQHITILPELDMVIAHKTDTGEVSPHGPGARRRSVSPRDYEAALRMLIAARPAYAIAR